MESGPVMCFRPLSTFPPEESLAASEHNIGEFSSIKGDLFRRRSGRFFFLTSGDWAIKMLFYWHHRLMKVSCLMDMADSYRGGSSGM